MVITLRGGTKGLKGTGLLDEKVGLDGGCMVFRGALVGRAICVKSESLEKLRCCRLIDSRASASEVDLDTCEGGGAGR